MEEFIRTVSFSIDHHCSFHHRRQVNNKNYIIMRTCFYTVRKNVFMDALNKNTMNTQDMRKGGRHPHSNHHHHHHNPTGDNGVDGRV